MDVFKIEYLLLNNTWIYHYNKTLSIHRVKDCMVSATHFKVLLKKNFLTLKRKWGFALFFFLLPIISMGIFTLIKYAISDGIKPEGHNFDRLYMTTNRLPAGFDNQTKKLDWSFDNDEFDNLNVNYLPIQCFAAGGLNKYALIGTKEQRDRFLAMTIQLQDVFKLTQLNFTTRDELWDLIETDSDRDPKYCFALQIDEFDIDIDKYSIQVIFLRKNIPDTTKPPYNPKIRTPDYTHWDQYQRTGYLAVYSMISDAIIRAKSAPFQPFVSTIDVGYMPMKTPQYESVNPLATEQLIQQFPFFVMFTFLIPLYYMVSKLAEEKEGKSREGMKMMGLKDSSYFLSWWIFHLILMMIMAALITAMCSINLFPNSNKLLIFLHMFFFGLSLFGFSLVMVAILPTVRSSATAATLVHLISYFLMFALRDPDAPQALKVALSIFPNVAMSFGLYNLYDFEANQSGLQFDNITQLYNGMTFLTALLFLIFSSFALLCLGLYLDQILQSQFGVAKKWYFPCSRKFWCDRKKKKSIVGKCRPDSQSFLLNPCTDDEVAEPQADTEDFEPVPQSLQRQEFSGECLKIRGLRKEFGSKTAVENSNINIYNGQIFALLGHNGAGKTTTISMLTGLIQASRGNASVFDMSIFDEMDEFRKILGVCPQHDVLFEQLTPKEHLQLFASFKGTPANQVDSVVNKMIKDIDLIEVENQLAGTLSGGQKRKLSVGIAMIGDSKVVILDEPSSGMDTSSRRRLWEMLKDNKNGKIVILTTHYMDEADILGDRICIMAEGKIKCVGSSLFLKNRYGVGYNLVIAKKDRTPAPQIDRFVFERIQGAHKLSEVSSEMTFQLPSDSASQFKDFFTQLDGALDSLGIRSYGVGITTLEEVFLKIAEDSDDGHLEGPNKEELKENSSKKGMIKENDLDDYSIVEQHEEGYMNNFYLSLKALLKKKFLVQVRDPRTLVIEMLFPIIFIFAGLALATRKPIMPGVPRLLTPTMLPSPSHLVFNKLIPGGLMTQKDLIDFSFTEDYWDYRQSVDVDVTLKPKDLEYMVSPLDNYLFINQDKVSNGFYGNYFIYNLNETEPTQKHYAAIALINATSQDAVAAYGAYLHQALLRKMFNNPNLKLNLTSQPFPLTLLEKGVGSASAGTFVSLMFAIAYMMVSDSLVQNIIRERQRRVKQQMIVSGLNLPAYWISHYLLDILFQAPPSICAIIGIKLFNLDFPEAWVIILVFILVNPLFIYVFSCMFDSDSSASIITRLTYVFIGAILPTAIQFLLIFPTTVNVGKVIKWFFYVLPIYSLNIGISNIANRQIMAIVFKNKDLQNPLSMEVAGPSLVFLAASIPLYWIVLALYENKAFRCRRQQREQPASDDLRESLAQNLDEDILEEENRVMMHDPAGLTVMVDRISKYYGSSRAVKRASFGLEYGECFALLGVSGAGKTTTFKCLTGEEIPTAGQVRINGHDVTTTAGFDRARQLIGYCPQFDAIFERLTVKEHLQFYAAMKGITAEYRERLIEKQIDEMDLREFENIRAEQLSGGNKRKLSVAMALIGNPPIIFLDEPSTGVDPKAKRFMWSIVSKISTQRKKSSVIITTHSMEEAEALCTKMGIMVGGKFRCFGSSQHIKAKYGTGYEIEVKIKYLKQDELQEIKEELSLGDYEDRINRDQINEILGKFDAKYLEQDISSTGDGSDFFTELNGPRKSVQIDEFIRWVFVETRWQSIYDKFKSMFSKVELLEHFSNSYVVKVSKDQYSIGFLFGFMEGFKSQFSISEYSVSQTTLEQIFNTFAKEDEVGNARKRTTVAEKKKENSAISQKNMFRLKSEKRVGTETLDN